MWLSLLAIYEGIQLNEASSFLKSRHLWPWSGPSTKNFSSGSEVRPLYWRIMCLWYINTNRIASMNVLPADTHHVHAHMHAIMSKVKYACATQGVLPCIVLTTKNVLTYISIFFWQRDLQKEIRRPETLRTWYEIPLLLRFCLQSMSH